MYSFLSTKKQGKEAYQIIIQMSTKTLKDLTVLGRN